MKVKLTSTILLVLGIVLTGLSFFRVNKNNRIYEEILKTCTKVNNAEQVKTLADGQVVCLQGPIEVVKPADDKELGIAAMSSLLEREVKYYQYIVRDANSAYYDEKWVDIPNTDDKKHGRENKPLLTLENKTFYSPDARIYGVKLPDGVLSQLYDRGYLSSVKLDQEGYDRLFKMVQEGYNKQNGSLVDKAAETATDDQSYTLKMTKRGFRIASNRDYDTSGDVDVSYRVVNPLQTVTVIGRIKGNSLTSLYLDGAKYYLVKEGAEDMEKMVEEEKDDQTTWRTGLRIFAVLLIVLGALVWVKFRKKG